MIGALVGGGLSIVGGLLKSGRAKKEERALAKQIANYKRQQLTNVADSLSVSTLGSDLAAQQSNIATATAIDALQKGGSRNLLGGISKVQEASNLAASNIQADLDERQKQIDQIRAEDEVRIRNTRENREISDLAGLGTALNAARQDRASGTKDIFSGLTGIAGGLNQMGVFGNLFGGNDAINTNNLSQPSSLFAPYMGDSIVPNNPITL